MMQSIISFVVAVVLGLSSGLGAFTAKSDSTATTTGSLAAKPTATPDSPATPEVKPGQPPKQSQQPQESQENEGNNLWNWFNPQGNQDNQQNPGDDRGMRNRRNQGNTQDQADDADRKPGKGKGNGFSNQPGNAQATRLTIDQAVEALEKVLPTYGSSLKIAKVVEFSQAFYALIAEEDSETYALALELNPYNGRVMQEKGRSQSWDTKYGKSCTCAADSSENSISEDDAADAAKKYLAILNADATLETPGMTFYGYYSYFYSVKDQKTGIISINGTTGAAWQHARLGSYVTEKDFD